MTEPTVVYEVKKPKPLTERQRGLLLFIIAYKEANQGATPTLRQMMRAVGIPSTSNVAYNLERLNKGGFIERRGGGGGGALDIRIPGAQWVGPDGVNLP